MPKKKTDLARKVMTQIDKEGVKMRPRLYFVLGSILLGIGLGMAVVFGAFFFNLAFFRLRVHEPFGFLWFGQFGLRPFIFIFPWFRLFLASIFIILGIILLRRYEISYKKSFLALALSLVILVLTAGFLIDRIGFNEQVRRIPPMQPFYHNGFEGQEWVIGEIIETGEKEIKIETPEGKEVTVKWDEKTLLPLGSDFQIGERIRAIGEWQEETTFQARGISQGGMPWREEPGGIQPSPPGQGPEENSNGFRYGPNLRVPLF
jgi:hypothetical protein